MAPITFPTSSSPGLRPQESAGRLINAFVEKSESGAPGQTLWRRSTGLTRAGSGTTNHTRGFQACRDTDQLATGERGWATAYWVTDGALHLLVEDPSTGEYSVNFIAPLGGEEPVTFGRNHAFPEPQVVVCTDTGAGGTANTALLSPSAPPVDYVAVDTDLPPSPTSVCGAHGYFVWSYQNGRIYSSDLNSTEVDALAFNTEQGQAVLRVVWFNNRLYAMGDKWIGVYRDAGAQPFPFLRESAIPRGLLNTHAVAGWEPGWANELIFVGTDHIVYKLNGYTPVPISNDAVSRDIQRSVLNGSTLEAFVYMYGRNAFWVLNAQHSFRQEEGYIWTWEYNATTGQWNERRSGAAAPGFCWRGHKSIRGSKEWLVGDVFTTALYRIREESFADEVLVGGAVSVPLIWTVESGVMSGFPNRTVIPRASFNITSGVGRTTGIPPGTPAAPNPKVKISWSLDGGATWGVPVERALGAPGDTRYYPSVICSGLSRGFGIRYRLVVEDAVHVGLAGGEIEVQPRAPV